jgi:hypothetical protein
MNPILGGLYRKRYAVSVFQRVGEVRFLLLFEDQGLRGTKIVLIVAKKRLISGLD